MPPIAFLFSIAGLSVTLAGFSGLVAAFRRGSEWKPLDSYRLRQIPEMGLATALIALLTVPLADSTHNATATVQVVCGLGLLFTVAHAFVLVTRSRASRISLTRPTVMAATLIDLAVVFTGAGGLATGYVPTYEWMLVAMLARPMLAFVLVLTELPAPR